MRNRPIEIRRSKPCQAPRDGTFQPRDPPRPPMGMAAAANIENRTPMHGGVGWCSRRHRPFDHGSHIQCFAIKPGSQCLCAQCKWESRLKQIDAVESTPTDPNSKAEWVLVLA